jgi:hypothetical protein
MSLLIWLRLILKLRHLVIHPAYLQTFVDLFWLIWDTQMAPPKQKQHKKQFSGCFGPFLLK